MKLYRAVGSSSQLTPRRFGCSKVSYVCFALNMVHASWWSEELFARTRRIAVYDVPNDKEVLFVPSGFAFEGETQWERRNGLTKALLKAGQLPEWNDIMVSEIAIEDISGIEFIRFEQPIPKVKDAYNKATSNWDCSTPLVFEWGRKRHRDRA